MAFAPIHPCCGESIFSLAYKTALALASALGQLGHDIAEPGVPQSGQWRILHAFETSTFTVVREGKTETITLLGGDRIYGQISYVLVSSGRVELYH